MGYRLSGHRDIWSAGYPESKSADGEVDSERRLRVIARARSDFESHIEAHRADRSVVTVAEADGVPVRTKNLIVVIWHINRAALKKDPAAMLTNNGKANFRFDHEVVAV